MARALSSMQVANRQGDRPITSILDPRFRVPKFHDSKCHQSFSPIDYKNTGSQWRMISNIIKGNLQPCLESYLDCSWLKCCNDVDSTDDLCRGKAPESSRLTETQLVRYSGMFSC